MPDIVVETPRLRLRQWRDSDLEPMLAHINTPAVKKHLNGVTTPEQVAATIQRSRAALDELGFAFLAVERISDGLFLGSAGFSLIETPAAAAALQGQVQIGWQLRVDAQGQGYATEAASHLLAHGFARHEWPIIYSQTSESNRPSWRLMQRLGMMRRAELDYADDFFPPEDNPTMIWSITREEFLQS